MRFPDYAEPPNPTLYVQFLDSLEPALTAGRYTLSAHQDLTRDGHPVDEGYLPSSNAPVTQPIDVRAPRFGVEPVWVHGAYPPAGASGTYDDVLPHVALTRPTLPWERADTGFKDRSGDRLPWMAVLLFGEGELEKDPQCLGLTEQRTVAQLSEGGQRPSDDAGVVLPAFDAGAPIPDDERARVCATILVSRSVFHAIAPTKDELPYLTHVRRVNEEHQDTTYSLDLITVGDYAVLTANRLPRASGGRYVAHLVSLEGWLSYLPEKGAEQYQGAAQQLRLISLWSWAFETLPDQTSGFAALTANFAAGQGADGSGLLLRIPVPDQPLAGTEQQEVAARLDAGYLPLSCRTEAGRSTFGWYRGPFTPEPDVLRDSPDRRRCAAEALIYLEQYGIFDVSLAVAFTAGRGVALADHQFCAALLRLRGKLRTAVKAELRTDSAPAGGASLFSSAGWTVAGMVNAVYASGEPSDPVSSEAVSSATVNFGDAAPGARAVLARLVLEGLAPQLAQALAAPLTGPDAVAAAGATRAEPDEVQASVPSVVAPVTPVPAATTLSAMADLTMDRLRADPALTARLRSAINGTAGVAPSAPATQLLATDVAQVDGDEAVLDEVPPPRRTSAGTTDEDLAAVRKSLIGLRNLVGVPFAHLVPDTRMLPVESLRFFHVDRDWTTTLVEGALSVGLAHRFDLALDDLVFGDGGPGELPEQRTPLTGLLIRSHLVTGWPALEVRPYGNAQVTEGESALPVVRRDALASDVLLVLIEGVPARVELAEPQQGVHFGIDEPEDSRESDPLANGIIRLRAVVRSGGHEIGQETGGQFPADPDLRLYVREPGAGQPDTVLRIGELAGGLRTALGLTSVLTPSQFAIQMINAAQRRTFRTGATGT